MKKVNLSALGIAILLSSACAGIVEKPVTFDGMYAMIAEPSADNELEEISADKALTKALSADLKFTFEDGDKIKVFAVPQDNSVLTYSLVPDSGNPSSAMFSTGAFQLNDQTYSALYPSFSEDYSAAMKFSEQKQTGNGSTAHLGAYDYSWAQTTIKDNAGAFKLAHKVSWIKVTVTPTAATRFSSLTVSANEGVAGAATLNVLTGEVSYTRNSDDQIELQLVTSGTKKYIEAKPNSPLVAYVTIPSGTYNNLYIKATDNKGVDWWYKTRKESELKQGRYYQVTLLLDEPGEDTPFTQSSQPGIYGATTSEAPQAVRSYDALTDYASYGTTSLSRTYKFFSVKENNYCVLTVTPKELLTGDDYTVTCDRGSGVTEGTYTIVKKQNGMVWLDNKENQTGYIIPIE